jgi:hypothetical protein
MNISSFKEKYINTKKLILETNDNNYLILSKEINFILLFYLSSEELLFSELYDNIKFQKNLIKKEIENENKLLEKYVNENKIFQIEEEAIILKYDPHITELNKINHENTLNKAKNYFSHISNLINPNFYKKLYLDDDNNSNSNSNNFNEDNINNNLKKIKEENNLDFFISNLKNINQLLNNKKNFEIMYEKLQKSDSRFYFAMVNILFFFF